MDEYITDDEFIKFNDSEENISIILNNKEVRPELKEKYIEKNATLISDIMSIEGIPLKNRLLKNGCIKNTSLNILNIIKYSNYQLNDELIEFINESTNSAQYLVADFEKLTESHQKQILDHVLSNESISFESYKSLLTMITFVYQDFKLRNIPEKRVKLLIEKGLISMSRNNIRNIEGLYLDLLSVFIESNFSEYYKTTEGITSISINEILSILKLENIELEQKEQLLKKCHIPLDISEIYSDETNILIFKNPFNSQQLVNAENKYSSFSQKIKKLILEGIISKINDYKNHSFANETVIDLMKSTLDDNNKIEVFSKNIAKLSDQEIVFAVTFSNIDKFNNLTDNSKISLTISPEAKIIMTTLEERGLINTHNERRGKIYGNKSVSSKTKVNWILETIDN